jgi:hypothetical protein
MKWLSFCFYFIVECSAFRTLFTEVFRLHLAFFSPFWTRRRKFQRTTERCHHTEYEHVCPVKFWYYNNLITNQRNTLIMRDVGKDSFVRSMEIRRDEGYSRILQEMSTMDNFISRKIRVVDHRNCSHSPDAILCTLKSFLNVLFWQMKQTSHWMGSYWERVTTLVCDIVETCSVLVKIHVHIPYDGIVR